MYGVHVNTWRTCTSIILYAFIEWYLVKQRNKFIFLLYRKPTLQTAPKLYIRSYAHYTYSKHEAQNDLSCRRIYVTPSSVECFTLHRAQQRCLKITAHFASLSPLYSSRSRNLVWHTAWTYRSSINTAPHLAVMPRYDGSENYFQNCGGSFITKSEILSHLTSNDTGEIYSTNWRDVKYTHDIRKSNVFNGTWKTKM
jgi:hypothetical protein